MRIKGFIVLVFTLSLGGLFVHRASAQSSDWSAGQEQEVDEGIYMTLKSSFDGWRIWKIETRSGIECRAIKSAVGRPHPVPVGAGAVFYRGTPFIQIMKGYRSPYRFSWETVHWGKVRVQYRKAGDRFWESMEKSEDDLSHLDGEKIEVHLTSWEYPELLVGFAEEKAVIDFSGMSNATRAIDECMGRAPI